MAFMRQIIAFGMLAALAMGAEAQAQTPVLAVPDLTVTPKGATLSISGRVIGVGRGNINATLAITKKDRNGSMNTSQSQDIAVSPGSSDVVASTQITTQDDLFLNATLTLRFGDVTIGSSSITLGGSAD